MSQEIMTNFMMSLDVMWKGMLGIFAVVLIIAALIYLMGKIPAKRKQDGE